MTESWEDIYDSRIPSPSIPASKQACRSSLATQSRFSRSFGASPSPSPSPPPKTRNHIRNARHRSPSPTVPTLLCTLGMCSECNGALIGHVHAITCNGCCEGKSMSAVMNGSKQNKSIRSMCNKSTPRPTRSSVCMCIFLRSTAPAFLRSIIMNQSKNLIH